MSSTKLALVLWDTAGVVGGILVPSVLFGRGAAKRSERQSRKGFSRVAKPRGKIPPSHANPASYASYMGYGTAEDHDFTENFI